MPVQIGEHLLNPHDILPREQQNGNGLATQLGVLFNGLNDCRAAMLPVVLLAAPAIRALSVALTRLAEDTGRRSPPIFFRTLAGFDTERTPLGQIARAS